MKVKEGAYYFRKDRSIVGPMCVSKSDDGGPDLWWGGGCSVAFDSSGICYSGWPCDNLVSIAHITHADPAEVVAELQRLQQLAAERSIKSMSRLWAAEDKGQMEAYNAAADLVAKKMVGGK